MIQYLVLDWHDPSCNMARYDVLSIERSLVGETTLTRKWEGRSASANGQGSSRASSEAYGGSHKSDTHERLRVGSEAAF